MAEREFRTTPQWPIATTPLSGDELVEVWKGGKQYYVPFSELGGMPAAHSGTHKHGGDDEVGTLDNLAYGIPKLDADGLIDSRISDATTTTKGKVQLATDGEEDATKAVNGTDSRLKDARPPTAHAAQHIAGTDVIADATVSNSGLMSAADKVKADATIPEYIPTEDQKAALVGTEGTASATNKYVTDEDGRLPTVGEKAALPGTSGTPGAANKYVTDSDGRLPTAGEKAALAGSYGTPSAVNRFVTESDPVLSSIGGGGGTTGPDLLGIGQIGEGLSITSIGIPALAGLNSTDVAFIDNTNKELRCYTFNGTDWTQKGNGLSIAGIDNNIALASLNSTDVAFVDDLNAELRCYTFNGTNWTQKGSGLSIGSVGNNIALASLNSTDVAFVDDLNAELRCCTFNGTNWTQKGSGLSIGSVGIPALASLNSTDIAFFDATNDELRCYTFDGANWTQKGSGLSITIVGIPALAGLNSTDVAFIDGTNGELRCYTFDGTNWTQKGSGLSITIVGIPALAGLNSTDVAFIDNMYDELRTYNFLFGYDSASINIAADYTVPEIATGKSIVIRRTSAYDGDPVTIIPPSGATIEGLSEYLLYEQYSSVTLERISSTVFAILAKQALSIKPLGNNIELPAVPTSVTRIIKIATVNWNYAGSINITCSGTSIIDAVKVHINEGSSIFSGMRVIYGKDIVMYGIKKMIVARAEDIWNSTWNIYAEITTMAGAGSTTTLGVVETARGKFTPSMTEVASVEGTVIDSLPLDYRRGDISSYQHEFTKDIIGNVTGTASKIPFATKTGASTGAQGQASFDASYLYLCTETNVWKRVALTSF